MYRIKLTIVLYAAVMLCFFHTVLFQIPGLEKNYLLAGFGISFAVLTFLTMFCINQKFAPWLLACSEHIKKESIKEKVRAGLAQMEEFSKVGRVVIKDKKEWYRTNLSKCRKNDLSVYTAGSCHLCSCRKNAAAVVA